MLGFHILKVQDIFQHDEYGVYHVSTFPVHVPLRTQGPRIDQDAKKYEGEGSYYNMYVYFRVSQVLQPDVHYVCLELVEMLK